MTVSGAEQTVAPMAVLTQRGLWRRPLLGSTGTQNPTAVDGRNARVIVYDRVIASCGLNGRSFGDLLRAAGGREGGR